MTMRLSLIAVACLSLASLSACGPTAQERCAGAKDAVTCMAAANSGAISGGGMSDMLVGGAVGAALASAVSRPAAQPVVVQHHAPGYGYRYAPRRASYFAPARPLMRAVTHTVTTTRSGLFGGRSVTSTTTSFRPSFRSRR